MPRPEALVTREIPSRSETPADKRRWNLRQLRADQYRTPKPYSPAEFRPFRPKRLTIE